ncbi:hypothetical protein Q7C36_012209 [Tachysurus vachellii]|uniref:CTNNB1 binding N-teminal domain-containing protein n=1 Tax=Tachysurus vachellii TaxID=175792 RepID=A0AA88SK43_TACVA|nr:hypothetical protein Q7C36_012209 [Tachysurus vachellii]
MPQLNGGGGDELGANDEMISFKDEGEQEDKTAESVSADRDLDDVKSSLVNESENNSSSSDSEPTERRPQARSEAESYERARECFTEALRRQQDGGGLFKSPHYPGYPFIMLPDLTSPYLPNGALSPTARTYLQMKWPLLDVPSSAALKDSRSPTPGHLIYESRVIYLRSHEYTDVSRAGSQLEPASLHQTGIPHPAIVSPAIKQEPNGELSPASHTKSPGPAKRRKRRSRTLRSP